MAAHGEIAPTPDFGVFADTGAEPENVMEWAKTLQKLINKAPHPFKIYTVKSSRGDLTEDQLKVRISQGKGKKPKGETYIKKIIPMFGIQHHEIMKKVYKGDFILEGDDVEGTLFQLVGTGKYRTEKTAAIGRSCTEDYKILPIRKMLRDLCKIKRGQKDVTVTMWIGISWDEAQRAKESRVLWCQHRWPMLEPETRMLRSDCINWMYDHGYPIPPRSACYYCPFHDDSEWRRMRDEDPVHFQKAVDFDAKLRSQVREHDKFTKMDVYLHNSCKPLDEVDFDSDEQKGQSTWDFRAECEGMCGV